MLKTWVFDQVYDGIDQWSVDYSEHSVFSAINGMCIIELIVKNNVSLQINHVTVQYKYNPR